MRYAVADVKKNIFKCLFVHGKNSFVEMFENLANKVTNLKIILLRNQNNCVRQLKISCQIKHFAALLITLEHPTQSF